MRSPRVYLDWNATAPLLAEAREAAVAALDLAGNPSSVHQEGRQARQVIEKARRSVAALVGALPAQVTFVSGATEAANLLMSPDWMMGRAPVRANAALVSAIEHPAFREAGRFAADQVMTLPVTTSGILDLAALEALLTGPDKPQGLFVAAIMLANNETGLLQPVAEAAQLIHAHGGLLVVDAVQAAGRVALDITELGADFLVLSSHKIGGPKGAGAVISRGEVLMPKPLIRGGGQEKGHRSGTENIAAIAGFGAAAEVAARDMPARVAAMTALRDQLEAEMQASVPDVEIIGKGLARLANTTFFHLPGLKAETGQIAFDLEGIALSAGSACSSGKLGASHVLTAMGRDAKIGALRLSIGPTTTRDEIDRALAVFRQVAARRKAEAA